jgi:chromosome segregation ATPase
MSPDTPGGQAARIERLERDEREARERRDSYLRDLATENRRVWQAIDVNRERLTRLETQAAERHREIREDIGDCSDKVGAAEGRLDRKIDEKTGELRAEVRKQREGTLTQKIAYITAAGAVIAAAIIAVAQVISALGGH